MNRLDIIIIAVLALSALAGYHRGLIRTIFKLVSFVVAVMVARHFYEGLASFMRQSGLHEIFTGGIASVMDLEGIVSIDHLPVPAVFQSLLHSYNTPAMFQLLQVSNIEEYIAGFFANMLINGLAMVLLFIVTLIGLNLVGLLLNVVTILPVIGTINQVGGLIFAVLASGVVIWVALVVWALFFAPINAQLYQWVNESWIAQRMFEMTLPQLVGI